MTKSYVCKISGCDNPCYVRGWCIKHYQRWCNNGDPLGGGPACYKTPEQAFAARVNKTGAGECWLWTGGKTKHGYGQLRVNSRKMLAHRFSWEHHNGHIPKGEGHHGTCVLHRCDNPSCVNPDHLWLGTQADNIADREAKGRGVRLEGEAHGNAKLTEPEVIAILADTRSQSKIAADYGVDQTTISQIKCRKTWKHVA